MAEGLRKNDAASILIRLVEAPHGRERSLRLVPAIPDVDPLGTDSAARQFQRGVESCPQCGRSGPHIVGGVCTACDQAAQP